ALDPELSPGDLLIPDNIMTDSNQVFHCHRDWSDQLRERFKPDVNKIITLPLFTAETVVTSSADKISLYKQFNAGAVDMEASVIAALANEQQIPCTVMRVIIDPADYSFPDYLMEITNEFGEVAIARLLMSALTHPQQLNKLIQLTGFYHRARKTLKILTENTENLMASPHES
ncbi:MAG: hypothetical protein HKN08_01700, partial [Gammaproteobacteria bacterium]|nr:hypothetical protein [Gammaproteobacteria bacterium]